MNNESEYNEMNEVDIKRLESLKVWIRNTIQYQFENNASKFSQYIGIDKSVVSALLLGKIKKAPRADLIWRIFEKFPDVTPSIIFGMIHENDSSIVNEKSIEYNVMSIKNDKYINEVSLLRAQLDYMRSLYENTLEKLILLHNSLKRE